MNTFLSILLLCVLTFSDAISLQSKHFSIRFFVNIVTKLIWLFYGLFIQISSFGFFLATNIIMLIFALLALQEDNSKRFFTLSNVAQMCVLTNFVGTDFFISYFILLTACNVYILAIMSILEKKSGANIVYIESFWGLFDRNKAQGIVFIVSILSLAGCAPFFGFFMRYAQLSQLYLQGQLALFWLNFVTLFGFGYAYMRWILATLLKKQIVQNITCSYKEILLPNICVGIGLAGISLNIATILAGIFVK